jgi:hypothetical protein
MEGWNDDSRKISVTQSRNLGCQGIGTELKFDRQRRSERRRNVKPWLGNLELHELVLIAGPKAQDFQEKLGRYEYRPEGVWSPIVVGENGAAD